MTDHVTLLRTLIRGEALSESQAAEMVGQIMDQVISPVQAGALLAALSAKGESVAEVIGAARAMRERSLAVEHGLPLVLDVVGTGGDGARTVNISTAAALVVAGCGVPVAKHGNRAASSACGSADVLESLGVRISLDPDSAAELLRSHQIAFLFAQRYHPAMKAVAPVRRDLGVPTIFNLLGPLTNPARAQRVMVGVARSEQLELISGALVALGVEAGVVFHSRSGLDEIAGDGVTDVVQFDQGRSWSWALDPGEFGVACKVEELRGGDATVNARALLDILEGEESPRARVVLLNASMGLLVAGAAEDLAQGMDRARQGIASGSAMKALEALRTAGTAGT